MRRTLGLAAVLVALGVLGSRLACAPKGHLPQGAAAPATAPGSAAEDPAVPGAVPVDGAAEGARLAVGAEGGPTGRAPAAATHRVQGRVLDGGRRPAGGAVVELMAGEVGPFRTSAREDGGFELAVALPPEVRQLEALAHDGRGSARRTVRLSGERGVDPEPVELGLLVLAPAHALRVRVTDGGRPAEGARVQVELGHQRSDAFEVHADGQGEVALRHLPRGPVHLTGTVPGRIGSALAFVPEEPGVELELWPTRAVELVVLDATDRAPIPGAVLEVWRTVPVAGPLPEELPRFSAGESQRIEALIELTSDAAGRARLGGLLPGTALQVSVRAQGFAPFPAFGGGRRFSSDQEELVLQLEPLTTRPMRWPVEVGDDGIPPDGARIELWISPESLSPGASHPAPPPARMEGQNLVAEVFQGPRVLLARAPDGALARLWAPGDSELGPAIRFSRPRRVEVRVRDPRGVALEGARVHLRNQGNQAVTPTVPTDPEGAAIFEDLQGGLVEVYVARPENPGIGARAGSVDLDAGDGSVEATLADLAPATLAVRIEGRPRLPGDYRVRWRQGLVRVVAEDPIAATLEIELEGAAPGSTARPWLDAAGYGTHAVELHFPPDGSPGHGELDLVPQARLGVTVRGPIEGSFELAPESFDAATGTWQRDRVRRLRRPNGFGGTFVFALEGPGRWRVTETHSGATSTEAELHAGQREARVELETAPEHWAAGRVELDDPAELVRVRVRLEGSPDEAPGSSWLPARGAPSGAQPQDGRFRLRVPGDREVHLIPWHPWLLPAPNGTARVREGRDDLVLRLVEGSGLRIVSPELAAEPRLRALRVARFAPGAPEGAPLEWHHAPLVDGVARCSLPTGRWDLWIDPGTSFAPLWARGVQVEGILVLDDLPFTRGSTLRVDLAAPEGQSPGRVHLSVVSLEGPRHQRETSSRGETTLRLGGLGPGPYRLRTSRMMDFQPFEQSIVLDGHGELRIELDLR